MTSVTEAELRYLIAKVEAEYGEHIVIEEKKLRAALRVYDPPRSARQTASNLLDQASALLEQAPLSLRNGEWALTVVALLARKQGFRLQLSDDEAADLIDRAQSPARQRSASWLVRRLLPEEPIADPQLGFFADETDASAPVIRAYVVSALTGLEEPDRKWVMATSEEAAAALRKIGIEVHQPALVSDPIAQPDIDPASVHALDYGAVLDSDLLVVLGNHPSWGGGKEIAWGEANGCLVVLILSSNRAVSRLVAGTSRDLEILSDDGGVASLLTAYVEEKRTALEVHAQKRMARNQRFSPILEALRLGDTGEHAIGRNVEQRRLDELMSSGNHLANATVEELADLAEAKSVSVALGESIQVRPQFNSRLARSGLPLNQDEMEALKAAIKIYQPPVDRVLHALETVAAMRSVDVKRRDPLQSAEDWLPFLRKSD